jgi:hypothetical protein
MGRKSMQLFALFAIAAGGWASGLWVHAAAVNSVVPVGFPCCETDKNTKNCQGCQQIAPGEDWVHIPENPTYGCGFSKLAPFKSVCNQKNQRCTTLDKAFPAFKDDACTKPAHKDLFATLFREHCSDKKGDTPCR